MFKIQNSKQHDSEKGVSLYLSILILSLTIAIVLGIATIWLGEITVTTGLGHSVHAFFAADAGIEHSLYDIRKNEGTGVVSGSVGDASYSVSVDGTQITSKGTYKDTKRAIEATY